MATDPKRSAPVYVEFSRDIDAPPSLVWELLSDIRGWPQWNAAVSDVMVLGELEPGTEFRWKSDRVLIVSTLQEVVPTERLLWTGRSPGVRATHLWRIESRGEGTRLYTAECFEGLLSRLLARPMTRMLGETLEQTLQRLQQA
ncbi:MAG: SRPBCC family protein, partial [Pseudomonadota bacterium]